MNSHPPAVSLNRVESFIDDLPDEVLEYILSLVPPYKDLQECSLVCKRWHRSVRNVIRHTQKNLHRAISDFNIMWEDITPAEMAPSITKRYSHSACRYGNSMYVFGGCTSTSTTFNDLWRLDLNKRQWVRPLTMGTYPSPKACATIICYKEALVLFGGWTHPSPYPLHQAWRLFSELHMYSIASNRWTCINTATMPPAMAGHSASVQGELMVVFGGLHKTNYMGQYGSSNDVWCFNLETQAWNKQATTETKPHPRYGQSQITLTDRNILILGGCGGPNMVFSDVWLLSMTEPIWTWREVTVRNPQWSAAHLWCHPACKMEQRVVVFSRNPVSNAPALPYTAQWNTPSQLRITVSNVWVPPREEDVPLDALRRASDGLVEVRPVDRDWNVNGRRGTFSPRPSASTSSSSGEESEPEAAAVGSKRAQPSSSKVPDPVPAALGPPVSVEQPSPKPFINSSFNEHENCEPSGSRGMGMAAFRDPSPGLRGINDHENSEPSGSRGMGMAAFRDPLPGLRGINDHENSEPSGSRGIGMAAFRDPSPVLRINATPILRINAIPVLRVNANRNRQRQLESLRRMEERIRSLSRNNNTNNASPQEPSPVIASPAPLPSPPVTLLSKNPTPKNAMAMFVLDISHVLSEECYVEWLPLKSSGIPAGGPEEMILYTLVAGKGELIMFGGIRKDVTSITTPPSSNLASSVSNSLHFISAPRGII